ncbi:SDR family NAD(P)-dependent oxidoreductase [uncultured Roseobacter sp.]|uniref:SDR family NAD(P)-dependent oxidoreductase n=1 Tax=uncultured Roseobacter sp. TaxID=114847 RepID=UPI00260220C5|nr:SDR family NAD(P)-dependent oxidoreductase [uncultured Roseobacter sp.]
MTESFGSAFIAGFGPGLGKETALKLIAEGLSAGMLARSAGPLEDMRVKHGSGLLPVPADVTDAEAVEAAVDHVESVLGPIKYAVIDAKVFLKGSILDFAPSEFERAWRVGAYGRFVSRPTAAKRMVARKKGTIIFSDATASLRGDATSFGFSGSKFGLRFVAQCMTRELLLQGTYVVHVIIDGVIKGHKHDDPGEDAHMHPKDLAEIYVNLHRQPRSTWTHELDVRPWCENSEERRSYDRYQNPHS